MIVTLNPDLFFYEYFLDELKRIRRRFSTGIEDMIAITIAVGIINTLFESKRPEMIKEAQNFIENYPNLKKFI